jgi:uncharacterized coiled-coil protein SlyX
MTTWAAAIAAIASILAAVLAYLSAQRAAREARSVTTLNHQVAALDRQADQMRDDYRDLIKAFCDVGNVTESNSAPFRALFAARGSIPGSELAPYSAVFAAGEVLRAHPRANES